MVSGDFFSAVTSSTIIAMMLDDNPEFSEAAFLRGVTLAQKPGGVMTHMFRTRSFFLFNKMEKKHIKAFASGVIIGSELAAMKEFYSFDRPVDIIASDALGGSYALALNSLGISSRVHNSEELSVKGLHLVAKHIKH